MKAQTELLDATLLYSQNHTFKMSIRSCYFSQNPRKAFQSPPCKNPKFLWAWRPYSTQLWLPSTWPPSLTPMVATLFLTAVNHTLIQNGPGTLPQTFTQLTPAFFNMSAEIWPTKTEHAFSIPSSWCILFPAFITTSHYISIGLFIDFVTHQNVSSKGPVFTAEAPEFRKGLTHRRCSIKICEIK